MNKTLIERVIEKLQKYPHIKFDKLNENELEIHESDKNGFPILLKKESTEYTLYFKAYHCHFDHTEDGENELLDKLYLGLSGVGRIKEFSKNDKIYKSIFELQDDREKWYDSGATVLLGVNFWTRPKIKYFQNHHLTN